MLTVEDILAGTRTDRMQSVGQMQVIPILGDDDDSFANPDVEVGTRAYGSVDLRNESDRPTIIPPGAGWVVPQAAQDHALGSGTLLKGKGSKTISTAMCIQQSQGGYVAKGKHEMLILPVALRTEALSMRNRSGYDKLWPSISRFNAKYGSNMSGAHMEYFLKTFSKELDQFIAQFELVPNQVGAVILIGGQVVGIERAPSAEYWKSVWSPLVRICYGSLALRLSKENRLPPETRIPLQMTGRSLQDLQRGLIEARVQEDGVAAEKVTEVKALQLEQTTEETQDGMTLMTVANQKLAGQIVVKEGKMPYASICAAQV